MSEKHPHARTIPVYRSLSSPSLNGRGLGGVGVVANGIPTGTFPLTLTLSRKGRGDFLEL